MSADWISEYIAQCLRTTGRPVSVVRGSGRGRYIVHFDGYAMSVTRRKIEAFTAALRLRKGAELPK